MLFKLFWVISIVNILQHILTLILIICVHNKIKIIKNLFQVLNKPLFPTRPILTEGLYSKPGDVEHLRLNLEAKIKSKVQKWRSHVKTIWNR